MEGPEEIRKSIEIERTRAKILLCAIDEDNAGVEEWQKKLRKLLKKKKK